MKTCSIQSCGTPVGSKGAQGMCPRHYGYWWRTGSPLPPVRPCMGCGEPLESRFAKYCSEECKPRCSIEDCDGAVRKRGWCASHYAQQQRSGRDPEPFKYKWHPGRQPSDKLEQKVPREPKAPFVPGPCLNCGSAFRMQRGMRRFCTQNCYQAYRLHGGPRPTSTNCVACGIEIDLTEKGKKGQQRKAVVKFCRPCKRDYNKYKMSARELAQRDGTDCGICGLPVDMTLTRADGLHCPSVDHVLPRSLGGSHDPSNLNLAHLVCNMRKSDRVGTNPVRSPAQRREGVVA